MSASPLQRALHRGEKQTKIELDQIDVGDGEHHFALEHYPLVEDVAQQVGKVEALVGQLVVSAQLPLPRPVRRNDTEARAR